MILIGVAESLSYNEDIACKIAFFNKFIGPDLLKQFVLGKQPSGIFDKSHQNVKSFSRYRQYLAVPGTRSVAGIDLELIENIPG